MNDEQSETMSFETASNTALMARDLEQLKRSNEELEHKVKKFRRKYQRVKKRLVQLEEKVKEPPDLVQLTIMADEPLGLNVVSFFPNLSILINHMIPICNGFNKVFQLNKRELTLQ